jgi:hypothetical protein
MDGFGLAVFLRSGNCLHEDPMLGHLRDLLNHMAWADGQFFHAWSMGPEEEAELRER